MEKLLFIENKLKDKGFFLLIILLCYGFFYPVMQNDTYWILNIGRYISQFGFPTIDPFTIHEGLSVSIQQWLSTLLFYFAHEAMGTFGIFLFTAIVYIASCFMMYQICKLVSLRNVPMAQVLTLTFCILTSVLIQPRPQIFSQLIFLLEIYFLEKYISEKRMRFLAWVVLLSILLVNLHAAMWPLFFILMLPYILDGIAKIKWAHGYGALPLVITMVLSFAAGLCNPYGSANMFYLFGSYGVDLINENIHEMSTPDFKSPLGLVVFILIIGIVIIIKSKGKSCLRHVLLLAGTFLMGLSSIRSLSITFMGTMLFVAYYLKDNHSLGAVFSDVRKRMVNYVAIFFIVIAMIAIKQMNFHEQARIFEPKGAVDYISLHVDISSMRLLNDFESGGFIEYHGIKTFIDSRCEIFLKSVNKKEDIFASYVDFTSGRLHYKDLIKKYDITHVLMRKEDAISIYLMHEEDYETLYSDELFVFLKVK